MYCRLFSVFYVCEKYECRCERLFNVVLQRGEVEEISTVELYRWFVVLEPPNADFSSAMYNFIRENIYVNFSLGDWVVFVLEFRNQTNVFLNVLSLLLHFSYVISTPFISYTFKHVLILFNNSEKLAFAKRLMESTNGLSHAFVFFRLKI